MIQDLNQFPPIPALVPKPDFSIHADTPAVCLDGMWHLLQTPEPERFAVTPGTDGYTPVPVPSWNDPLHQPGFCGAYIYKTTVPVTPEMAASRVVLRMEGVNGFAAVYINGIKAAEHKNSFLTWNTEITALIQGCDSFELSVAVDEREEKVSSFGHGGLLHSVWLYLLPSSFFRAVHTTTTFDAVWKNAELRIDYSIDTANFSSGSDAALTNASIPTVAGTSNPDAGAPMAEAPLTSLSIRGILTDPAGNTVAEGCFEEPVTPASAPSRLTKTLAITSPLSWDAEHPRLYTLTLELISNGTLQEIVRHPFGFRQLTRSGNQLFVNGKEVKLRGSCRHEITARNGRCLTPELIEADVRLFKEANCNYIRTSHYPPSEYFLTLCDRYGIYVEDEMALAFIARSLDYTQQDPLQTQRYLSHFADLVARDYSHPSVIIWSLCNESFGGINFDLLNRFVKSADPTRVTKFSYPMTMREEYEPIDIWSIHYSNYDADLAKRRDNVSVGGAFGKTMPVIHDEYVHVPCYNRTEQRRDPYVREFWGQSLAHFWSKIWRTKGALGGAIWAGIDESDIYDGGNTCLEWGIIDLWRRKKPEHYATRKAYSPVVLRGVNPLTEEIAAEWNEPPAPTCLVTIKNQTFLTLRAENRFCHTNLDETTIYGWCFHASDLGDRSIENCRRAKSLSQPAFTAAGQKIGSIAPFESGNLVLPVDSDADFLYLEWYDACGEQVDEFLIPISGKSVLKTDNYGSAAAFGTSISIDGSAPADTSISADTLASADASIFAEASTLADTPIFIDSAADALTIRITGCSHADDLPDSQSSGSAANTLRIVFNPENGLLSFVSRNEKPAITAGPTLHIPYLKLPAWKLDSFGFEQKTDCVLVTSRGHYGNKAAVTWLFTISFDGSMAIRCTIDRLSALLPPQIKLRVGVDCGGLDELGFTLETAPGADRIHWNRTGEWSIYPEDSIGRCIGTAVKGFGVSDEFGCAPSHPWKDDLRHDILNGRYDPGINGSNDFCATKPNLYCAVIDSKTGLTAPIQVLPAADSKPLHLRAEAAFPADCIFFCQDSRIRYSGSWYAMTDSSSESSGHEMWSNEAGAKAEIPFTGTGIVWYAPVDVNYGQARVLIDGKPADRLISQQIDGVDFAGSSAGFDKKYHYPVFSVTGLENAPHTLTIEVLGTHAADSCDSYIVLEEFRILTPDTPFRQPLLLHLLKDFNFPHLSWGNRKKPAIRPADGETMEAVLRF